MLAPMAGITDLPFRQLVRRFGVDVVVSEMVACRDLLSARPGAREKAQLGFGDEATAIQLAGCDPYWMAEAARLAQDNGARLIDINMGCPAKKVTGGQSGSALMRDLDLAVSLIRAVVGAVKVPVTLKCRLGWDANTPNAPELARRAEAEGICRMVIHGRTRCQFYKGRADWVAIRDVAETVHMPIIANGDICDLQDARTALKLSGATGVMIGRFARGRPWLCAQIRAALAHAAPIPVPSDDALAQIVSEHYRAMLSFYGAELGGRVARKHLGWYMDQAATPTWLRQLILTRTNPDEVLALLPDAFATSPRRLAA